MTNFEKALTLAIQKGDYEFHFISNSEIILDPKFWKSLLKALGIKYPIRNYTFIGEIYNSDSHNRKWLYYPITFFELKMLGKDEEKFWQELLN